MTIQIINLIINLSLFSWTIFRDDEWTKHLLDQIRSKIEILMIEWGEMGIQNDFLLQRRASTEKHFSALLDDMIREETLSKLEMKERILKLEVNYISL